MENNKNTKTLDSTHNGNGYNVVFWFNFARLEKSFFKDRHSGRVWGMTSCGII